MQQTKRFAAAALALALTFAAGWLASAQVQVLPSPPGPVPSPTIISGDDIGFRVESNAGGVPRGTLVVRVDGEWVEPRFSPGVRRLTQR